MRVAVVGHVEWIELLHVERVPEAGAIIHATAPIEFAGGGGAVAAVQLARWAGGCRFYTALGDDALGHRAHTELTARGVDVRAVFTAKPQRRGITFVDANRERTIVVIGERLVATAADPLPWDELATFDGVYITGCDAGAIRAARRARVVVATSRIVALVREAAVELDALVGSANDPAERYLDDLVPAPRLVVRTDGSRGGTFAVGATEHRYAALPCEVTGDTYGAGDTFAAGLAFALAEARTPADAVHAAARRAVEVLGFNGPYAPG